MATTMMMTARQNYMRNGWLPWDEWYQMYADYEKADASHGQKCLFQ